MWADVIAPERVCDVILDASSVLPEVALGALDSEEGVAIGVGLRPTNALKVLGLCHLRKNHNAIILGIINEDFRFYLCVKERSIPLLSGLDILRSQLHTLRVLVEPHVVDILELLVGGRHRLLDLVGVQLLFVLLLVEGNTIVHVVCDCLFDGEVYEVKVRFA